METRGCVVLWLTLVLSAACGAAVASQTGKTPPPSPPLQPDALSRAAEEFKVLTREEGMRPESPPNVQKHGPKMLWHGRVYENFRNDILDAIPHEVRQNGETASPLRRNQFGFNIGGPVLLPHLISNPKSTFFMVSYEGVREIISRASLHTIPTALQRTGDFSQTVDPSGNLLPIYDPDKTSLNPAYNPNLPVSTTNLQYLRSQFPGNIIPPSRLAKNVQQALSLYSEPNTDIGPFFQNNYFVNAPEMDTADGIIAKLERQIHDRHRITSNTTISRGFLSSAKYFPNIASPTAPDQHFSTWRSELDYVYTSKSKTVNTASLMVSSAGTMTGDGSQSPFPNYQLLGDYLSMGTAYPSTTNARNTFEVSDGISTRKGNILSDLHSRPMTIR